MARYLRPKGAWAVLRGPEPGTLWQWLSALGSAARLSMNISGILVVVPPERYEEAVVALSALQGVDVHHSDPVTGRIVVTQEAGTVGEEVAGLRRIKSLPFVTLAEMVYHHFEESDEAVAGLPPELEEPGGLPQVPPYLNE